MREKKGHITGFYIETLLLIVVFISIILVISHIFGLAQSKSARAKHLTNAVTLAQNAAEAVEAAKTPDEVFTLLNENANAVQSGAVIDAGYGEDLSPLAGGIYTVSVQWSEENELADCVIDVYVGGSREALYTLHTASYIGEGVR